MGMYSKHSAESVAEHNWMHTEYVWNTSGYGQDTLEYVFGADIFGVYVVLEYTWIHGSGP